MPPSKAAQGRAGARRVLELQRAPKCAIDAVVNGVGKDRQADESFKQVEASVAKLPADAAEVVLRCMVHAVNTSDSRSRPRLP